MQVAKNGPVTTITINRPDRSNAVDRATGDALREAFLAFDSDDTVGPRLRGAWLSLSHPRLTLLPVVGWCEPSSARRRSQCSPGRAAPFAQAPTSLKWTTPSMRTSTSLVPW